MRFCGALARLELRLNELAVAIEGVPNKPKDARRAIGVGQS